MRINIVCVGKIKEKYLKQFGDENPSKNKRNLFITTGFISTINAMSIIDSETQNSDNYLIVYSSNVSDKFKEYNLKLILDGYFKNIIFLLKKAFLNSCLNIIFFFPLI